MKWMVALHCFTLFLARVNFCKLIFSFAKEGKNFSSPIFHQLLPHSLLYFCANSICMIKLNFFRIFFSLNCMFVLHFTNSWTSSISECIQEREGNNFFVLPALFYVFGRSKKTYFSLISYEKWGRRVSWWGSSEENFIQFFPLSITLYRGEKYKRRTLTSERRKVFQ